MGRTNPRLVPFLKENLEKNSFNNLKYEPESLENNFYIELPRYDKDRCEQYESILKAWYGFNGKKNRYNGYSNGKSVFQAALKKSVYLISLPSIGKKLRYRFANIDEIEENKRLQKEKIKSNFQPLSPSNPPSVASSGYSSSNELELENMQTGDRNMQMAVENNLTVDTSVQDILDGFLKDLGNPCGDFDDLFSDITLNNLEEESVPFLNISPDDEVPCQTMQEVEPVNEVPEFMKPVTELKPTPVGNFESVKKYWLCTQKVKVKGTLQLICEMQVIEDPNSTIIEGSVVIPEDVFEPGVSYDLNKSFELNDLQFYFFSPNSA